jgi:simple sugar transport system ATP-binding protein
MGERQRVEILKALYRNARILILDEPTAVLTPQESRTLFKTLRQLLDEGLSIIFISHKLAEVLEVSDRIVVLRDGKLVLEVNVSEASEEILAEAMVGRSFKMPIRKEVPAGESLLTLENVTVSGSNRVSDLDQASFSVHAREVVGLAGISGNGQRILADIISGMQSPTSGKVFLYGKPIKRFHPREMLMQKVGRIPEDRQGFGVVGDMNLAENVITEVYKNPDYSKLGFLNLKNRQNFSEKVVQEFDVRGVKKHAPVRLLSGGNMQKLILGRVLMQKPKLILAHQPARGLDIGAASFVYERLLDAKMQGCGILLISEDLEELLRISDRVLVIHRGKIIEAGKAGTLSTTNLGLLMAGRQADAS